MNANTGVPRHLASTTRLSAHHMAIVRKLVASRGYEPTAKLLGTAPITLDRLMGPGTVRARVAQRLCAALDALEHAPMVTPHAPGGPGR